MTQPWVGRFAIVATIQQQYDDTDFMVSHGSSSGDYKAISNRLREAHDDLPAVHAAMSEFPDLLHAWMPRAYEALREALTQGKLSEGHQTGHLIGVVLRAQDTDVSDELADHRIHEETLQLLIDGIGAVLEHDHETGLEHLTTVTAATYTHEALQWLGWFWIGRAAAEIGDMSRSLRAARQATEIGPHLGKRALSASLSALGEIKYQMGDLDDALTDLSLAVGLCEDSGDKEGMSCALLVRAQMLAAAGDVPEAIEAATRARQENPGWEQPVIFLARQAIIEEQLDQAAWVLQVFYERQSTPPEIARELRLVELGRQGTIDPRALSEFTRLRGLPPVDDTVARMRRLLEAAPHFMQLHDLYAWTLFKRGFYDLAAGQFEQLAEQDLDDEIRASALLGLGCTANRRSQHRQLGARLHAARSAGKQVGGDPPPMPQPDAHAVGQPNLEASNDASPSDTGATSDPQQVTEFEAVPTLNKGRGGTCKRIDRPKHDGPQQGTQKPSKVAFTGDLAMLAVPDLLDFLCNSHRTGTVVISGGDGIGVIQLRGGRTIGCASPNSPSVGACLVQTGALNQRQLDAAIDESNRTKRLLGVRLVEDGLVSEQQVREALTAQIEAALLELVGWSAGRFAFDPDDAGEQQPSAIEVDLDTRGLLLDSLRKLDEQQAAAG